MIIKENIRIIEKSQKNKGVFLEKYLYLSC